jgi:hypothetical protein
VYQFQPANWFCLKRIHNKWAALQQALKAGNGHPVQSSFDFLEACGAVSSQV